MEAMNWGEMLSRRARVAVDGELATILAGPPPGTLGMTGGFPNPATFATDLLVEIAERLVRDEPGIALQYTASEGIPSVREYLIDRVEATQGRRPEWAELGVTSGGMECIDLVSRTLLDPGDARRRRGADLPRRDHGLRPLPGRADRHPDGRGRDAGRASSRNACRPGSSPSSST